MKEADHIREYVAAALTNLKAASLAIGRNPTYIQQYLRYNKPKELPERVRESLAREYHLDPKRLRSEPAGAASDTTAHHNGEQENEAHSMIDPSEFVLLEAYRELTAKSKATLLKFALELKTVGKPSPRKRA